MITLLRNVAWELNENIKELAKGTYLCEGDIAVLHIVTIGNVLGE